MNSECCLYDRSFSKTLEFLVFPLMVTGRLELEIRRPLCMKWKLQKRLLQNFWVLSHEEKHHVQHARFNARTKRFLKQNVRVLNKVLSAADEQNGHGLDAISGDQSCNVREIYLRRYNCFFSIIKVGVFSCTECNILAEQRLIQGGVKPLPKDCPADSEIWRKGVADRL